MKQIIQKIFAILDHIVDTFLQPIFRASTYLLYFLYISIFLGVFYVNVEYTKVIIRAAELIIAIVLVIKFNTFRKVGTISEFERKLIFSSAVILLTNIGITEYIIRFVKVVIPVDKIKNLQPISDDLVAPIIDVITN